MEHRVVAGLVVQREPRAPAPPVLIVRRLRIVDKNLFGGVIPVRHVFPVRSNKPWDRRAPLRLVNAAVHLVAQSVINGEARASFPDVLKIKVVGFPAYSGFIEAVAGRGKAGRPDYAVRGGSRGQKSSQGIGQRISGVNIMRPAGGRNQHRRISRPSAKAVSPVGIDSENCRVTIEADLHSPLESMIGMNKTHVLFELVEI